MEKVKFKFCIGQYFLLWFNPFKTTFEIQLVVNKGSLAQVLKRNSNVLNFFLSCSSFFVPKRRCPPSHTPLPQDCSPRVLHKIDSEKALLEKQKKLVSLFGNLEIITIKRCLTEKVYKVTDQINFRVVTMVKKDSFLFHNSRWFF